ncbi:MAG: arginine deiminase-related protein [Bacteroidota bacterium]|nr:arginine deiminase-related protein [Bacteroidota bacterium]
MQNLVNQAPDTVMMIRPVLFGFNEQTASTNSFQQKDAHISQEVQENALKEFNGFVARLRDENIEVVVFDDTLEPHKPDSIFPNNWISFHHDGTVVLYPMHAANRRFERRGEFLISLQKDHNFDLKQILDFSKHEDNNQFLEGTGSIVFDYINKIAYANQSPRTDIELLEQLTEAIDYSLVKFNALDKNENSIYHTNVVMCIGEKFAVICTSCIPTEEEKNLVLDSLQATGHEIIDISYVQLVQFAGNMMEVKNKDGKSYVAMSSRAFNSLSTEQRMKIEKYANPLPIDIGTIEKYGGGSVRCMLAGIFLPKLKSRT